MICPACGNKTGAHNYCGYCGQILTDLKLSRVTIACLRADVSGFTRLTMGVEAEVAFSFLKLVLTNAAQKIEEAGGLIYRFIGDEVVGIFGIRPFDYRRLFECGLYLTKLEAFGKSFGMKVGIEEGEAEYARIAVGGVERELIFGDIFLSVARIQKSLRQPGLAIGPRLCESMMRQGISEVRDYCLKRGGDG
ncbi:hypothetical protein DRP53_08070 [candidate division WOR-3 bacterium]|uniref:Guanylate cyclase domain-containing protein n=1 Tax=candidate division WOR-3 bacterium TaxID=2052148 RepID=A0A660SFY8_UNCW3|nr:MAG: hypothetical protein DRP53_08070 [candidate division WOR-3 bacterium]